MNIYHKIYTELQKNKCYFCNTLMNDINTAFDKNKIKNSNHFMLNHNSGYCECGLNYVTFSKFDRDFSNIKFSYLLTNLHIWVTLTQISRYIYEYDIGLYGSNAEEHLYFSYKLNTYTNELVLYVTEFNTDKGFIHAESKEDLFKIENRILKEMVFE